MELYQTYKTFLQDLEDSKTIVLACRCSIEYWGRSRSVIGGGDRVVIFKPDSTLIVHSPKGFKPVNWMSPPTDTAVEIADGALSIFSQRTVKPFEEIKILVERVIGYSSYDSLHDREKIDVTHTERDMREHIAKNPHEIDPQFKLKEVEHKTPVGLIDIYGKIEGKYCVVELKSVRAGLPAVLQLKRYRDYLREKLCQDVHAMLMAPSIAKNPMELMKKEGMTYKKFDVRSIRLDKKRHTLDRWM